MSPPVKAKKKLLNGHAKWALPLICTAALTVIGWGIHIDSNLRSVQQNVQFLSKQIEQLTNHVLEASGKKVVSKDNE
jgi:cell division protein FtsL